MSEQPRRRPSQQTLSARSRSSSESPQRRRQQPREQKRQDGRRQGKDRNNDDDDEDDDDRVRSGQHGTGADRAQQRRSVASQRPSAGDRRASSSRYSVGSTTSYGLSADDDGDDNESAAAPAQTIRDVSQAFRAGRPSPYHMAVVTLIGSLASGMPLASMFKVYTFVMCEVYDPRIRDKTAAGGASWLSWFSWSSSWLQPMAWGPRAAPYSTLVKLLQAPELPNPPECALPWVQKSTSTYSAAMVTVGALLGLMILSRASGLSRRFGRKPLLLLTHLFLALALLVFRLAVLLPPYAAAVVLYCAVVLSEASAGAPLRIALQNYVVDTTTESQRAGALSFIEGFGQIGAFPSSALGGLLASLSGEFFAPFYANIALMVVAFVYILVLVPESKRKHEHTLIDSWTQADDVEGGRADSLDAGSEGEEDGEGEAGGQQADPGDADGSRRRTSTAVGRGDGDGDTEADADAADADDHPSAFSESARTWSTSHAATDESKFKWRSKLRALNFLRPLSIFKPTVRHYSDVTAHDALAAPPSSDSRGDDAGNGKAAPSTAIGRIQKRVDFRLLNLALVVVFEETYQCFLVPLLLLYNGQKFGFDVLQNGYLVSVLQSVRALFLTAIFPPAMALARRYVARRGLARRKEKLRRMRAEAKQQRRRRQQTGQGAGRGAASGESARGRDGGGDEERRPLVRSRDSMGRPASGGEPTAAESRYGTMTSRDYGLTERRGGDGDGDGDGDGGSAAAATATSGATDSATATATTPDEARTGRRRPSYHAAASLGGLSRLRRSASQTTAERRRRLSYQSRAAIESNWETHSIFTRAPSELIKKIQRGKLDIGVMLASYLLACIAFVVLASSTYAPGPPPRPPPPIPPLLADIASAATAGVAVEAGSGSGAGALFWKSPWIPLTLGVVLLQVASGSTSLRTALVVNAVAEDDQTKALAAHQILVTSVNAFMPLATSAVYGIALERGRPELVWLFKALFAALALVGACGLFWSHRGFYEKAHDDAEEEEEEGVESSSDDEEEHEEHGHRRQGVPGASRGGSEAASGSAAKMGHRRQDAPGSS
ncbi:uncharacterized protein PFL1_02692 [Pseudozyma flocculosa PF-1]|uniref:Major facilitator superfamily (MFS) profile domain-containing protein n=2 Tax=Pseudozyma flocculosa TaxID=84751 RepID=A0A5C3EYL2_9BASI|nr:uncharacterized protein PFL1_02692 [Pseudozyma flocculosa PF-1]EPQ30019.1 hypothetical protein PFL1_02692 [Pseudozyma flocculosa PF-1]SPO37344.1 uncharacterized protein PSFLO_02817 [Pseudozyma flocculosa]